MIRLRVLGQQTSHLLLIRTNLDYGNVLTAACARQGCSASGLVRFLIFSQFNKESLKNKNLTINNGNSSVLLRWKAGRQVFITKHQWSYLRMVPLVAFGIASTVSLLLPVLLGYFVCLVSQ
jgi:hypothetical protein